MIEIVKKEFKISNLLIILILVIASILRLWNISKVPVSLFSDELDIGYQAYSIIKTGKDYMGNPWPLAFQSYADARTPLYIYSAIPSVYFFGITPLGVRFPAILFGVLGILALYLLISEISDRRIAIIAAILLSLSPWHIQYSRAAFEVTELLFFLLIGLYFFFRADRRKNLFWLSSLSFALTPWIYNTAKFFTPMLLIFLFLVWRKKILEIRKKDFWVGIMILILSGTLAFSTTFLGDGIKRFGYISIFSDPTATTEVRDKRLYDAQFRQTYGGNVLSKVASRIVHNRGVFLIQKISDNYLSSFSTDLLFTRGDLNLRHSIEGVGQLYKTEAIVLLLGIISFFSFFKNKKIKLLIGFWMIFGVIPAAITQGGGGHATRLIIILPPLVFLAAYGLVEGTKIFNSGIRLSLISLFSISLLFEFFLYQHTYWIHNPWYSERSWHAGYKEVVQYIKSQEVGYDKIIITNSLDDPKIFFASYYPIDPEVWQGGLEKEYVSGFGELSHLEKFYFGQVDGTIGLAGLAGLIGEKVLYVAAQREIKDNLIMDPQKTPPGLTLVKAIPYPSGEPAFYFLEKRK